MHYNDQGQYTKAEPLCQRALAIREKVCGSEHRDVANSLNNLAALYKTQGQYADAFGHYLPFRTMSGTGAPLPRYTTFDNISSLVRASLLRCQMN
jgi:hypothetical protein